jgi:hypothetical protein
MLYVEDEMNELVEIDARFAEVLDSENLPDPPEKPNVLRKLFLTIYMEARERKPVVGLRFRIIGFTEEDRSQDGKPSDDNIDPVEIGRFINWPEVTQDGFGLMQPEPTQLDFASGNRTRVFIRLFGSPQWHFKTARSALVIPKKNGSASNLAKLKGTTGYRVRADGVAEVVARNEACNCISFLVDEPPGNKGDKTKVYMVVNFMDDDGVKLPVLIDPNVENKGGNP